MINFWAVIILLLVFYFSENFEINLFYNVTYAWRFGLYLTTVVVLFCASLEFILPKNFNEACPFVTNISLPFFSIILASTWWSSLCIWIEVLYLCIFHVQGDHVFSVLNYLGHFSWLIFHYIWSHFNLIWHIED